MCNGVGILSIETIGWVYPGTIFTTLDAPCCLFCQGPTSPVPSVTPILESIQTPMMGGPQFYAVAPSPIPTMNGGEMYIQPAITQMSSPSPVLQSLPVAEYGQRSIVNNGFVATSVPALLPQQQIIQPAGGEGTCCREALFPWVEFLVCRYPSGANWS